MGVLGEKPFLVKLDLNEWLRFEKPGKYTLSVRSQRVSEEANATPPVPSVLPPESNTVSFEILPRDPDWEAAELGAALRILGSKGSDMDRRKGCRTLRFLGTDLAVDEMIKRYGDDQWGCEFEFTAGLFSARDRERVVRLLEAGLRAADQPVSAVLPSNTGGPDGVRAASGAAAGPDTRHQRPDDSVDRAGSPYGPGERGESDVYGNPRCGVAGEVGPGARHDPVVAGGVRPAPGSESRDVAGSVARSPARTTRGDVSRVVERTTGHAARISVARSRRSGHGARPAGARRHDGVGLHASSGSCAETAVRVGSGRGPHAHPA